MAPQLPVTARPGRGFAVCSHVPACPPSAHHHPVLANNSSSRHLLADLHATATAAPSGSTRPHPPCGVRGPSVVTRAAGRGGGGSSRRNKSSSGVEDDRSSSAWQDRLYNRGVPLDSSPSTSSEPQQQRQQRSKGGPFSKQGLRDQQSSDSAKGKSASRGGRSGSGGGSSSSAAPDGGSAGSSDFVVIKKASADAGSVGAYIPTSQEQQEQEDMLDGSRYWEAALADYYGDEDEDEDEDDEDEFEGGGLGPDEGNDDDDVEVEEVVALLRELAAGLEEEEQEGGEADSDDDSAGDGHSSSSSSSSSSGAGVEGLRWRQAYLGADQPPLSLGPLCVKQTAGTAGRGLFTTEAVSAGQLLLVAAPLALLYSEQGTTPENEELADHLAAAVAATAAGSSSGSSKGLAPWQQHALLQLRGPGAAVPSSSSSQQQQKGRQLLPDLLKLLGPPGEPVQLHGGSSSSSGGGGGDMTQQQAQQQQQQGEENPQQQQQQGEENPQQQQQQQQLPSQSELLQVVFANCTGEEFEDPALVLLRGSTSCGHLGVWPAAALINHSCAPNCHAMLLGDRLVVRAGRDVPTGSEVTLSYLGPQLFAPAAERQAELRQQWGFDCGCSRCKAEARYATTSSSSSSSSSVSLSELLQTTYSRCQELSPQLDAAVDAEDLPGIRAVQRELMGLQEGVEGSIRAAKPPVNVRRWLQACVYDLYDLLSLAADQLPPPPPKAARGGRSGRGGRGRGSSSSREVPAVETEALATCVRIVGELTPGSSAHVELATEYMVRTEARFGVEHQEAADASRLCVAAITTRYGPLSNSMLQLLVDTWAGSALL